MKKSILLLLLSTLFSGCFSSTPPASLPFFEEFKDTKQWSLDAKATFDPSISTTPGSGSIRLTKAANNWMLCDRILLNTKLPIVSGETYTLSFKIKTNTFPPPSLEVYGEMWGEDGMIENSDGTMVSNSQKGVWEESFVAIKIPKNDMIKYFKIKILMLPKHGISAPIWIDDIRFEKGLKLPKKPSKKHPFDGKITRIDSLGNVEIFKEGHYKPFFPIGIYTDDKREDWSLYKKLGFNTAMWTSNAQEIQKAKEASLYASMQIVQYMFEVDWIPQEVAKKMAHLTQTLQSIKNNPALFQNLLFYYIDNELYTLQKNLTQVVDKVREIDQKSHPIYMLNGAYGMARKYNHYSDLTGTYVAKDGFETPLLENFEILDYTPNQTQPVVFAQINRGVKKNFRPIVYGALAKGAKAIAFWRDGGSAGDITKRPIAKELPKIAQEIQKLLPLIRVDHHTTWSATCSDKRLIFGTRTMQNEGYMLIANPTRKKITAIFTLKNLPYTPQKVLDYFTHTESAKPTHATFTLTIDPQDAKVVKLAR